MKKLYTLIPLAFFGLSANAQQGNPSPTIGDYFVEGISPIMNTITPSGEPGTAWYIDFYASNPTYTQMYDSLIDNTGGGPWSWNIDMGSLPNDAVIWMAYYDNGGNLIDYSFDYVPTIIPTPQWMIDGGTVNNIIVVNNIIQMDCHKPFNQNAPYSIPSNIKGLSGRPFTLTNPEFYFNNSFDMATGISTTSNSSAQLTLNTLGQNTTTWPFTFSTNIFQLAQYTFDFNPVLIDSLVFPVGPYECNFPNISFPIPAAPFVKVKVSGGATFYAELKGKIVFGQSGGNFGFIDSGGQKSKIVAKAEGTGFVRAGINVLGGLADASGTLTLEGRIGGGLEYVQFPSPQLTLLSGGDFSVYGEIKLKSFWGLGPSGSYGPYYFYNSPLFGNTPYGNLKTVANSFENIFGTFSKTYPIDGTLSLPNNSPQPAFGIRDNKLYTVWVESDISNYGYLLMVKLDTTTFCLSPEILVETNNYSIGNPQVGIMPTGDAVITWTENRYNISTLPPSPDANNLRNASDIWCAIYNNSTNTIDTSFMINDINTGPETGRAEGEAKITMGSGTDGLITWVAKDPSLETTDIWFTKVSQIFNVWQMTTPAKLADLPGINTQVRVSYTNATEALAVWINDPDGADSTLDTRIMFSSWNGTSWTPASALTTNTGVETIDELSMDYNDNYCVITWASSVLGTNGDFDERIDIAIWDDILNQWTGQFFSQSNLLYLDKPRISISSTGIASVCFQVIDMFNDTTSIDPGEVYVFLNDLNNLLPNWVPVTGNQFVGDTTTYIWELATGFGAGGNKLYMLSQEYNSTGPITNPANGVLFGDPDLSMAIRAVVVNANLTVSNIPEPCNIPTGYPKDKSPFNFQVQQNYPNPFNSSTTIEFHISGKSNVMLEVYDMAGRLISQPINQKLSSGIYQTVFDSGNLNSGIYFYKLTIDNQSITKKMIITK